MRRRTSAGPESLPPFHGPSPFSSSQFIDSSPFQQGRGGRAWEHGGSTYRPSEYQDEWSNESPPLSLLGHEDSVSAPPSSLRLSTTPTLCPVCDTMLESPDLLREHNALHHFSNRHQNPDHRKTSGSPDMTQPERRACKTCGQSFWDMERYYEHVTTMHSEVNPLTETSSRKGRGDSSTGRPASPSNSLVTLLGNLHIPDLGAGPSLSAAPRILRRSGTIKLPKFEGMGDIQESDRHEARPLVQKHSRNPSLGVHTASGIGSSRNPHSIPSDSFDLTGAPQLKRSRSIHPLSEGSWPSDEDSRPFSSLERGKLSLMRPIFGADSLQTRSDSSRLSSRCSSADLRGESHTLAPLIPEPMVPGRCDGLVSARSVPIQGSRTATAVDGLPPTRPSANLRRTAGHLTSILEAALPPLEDMGASGSPFPPLQPGSFPSLRRGTTRSQASLGPLPPLGEGMSRSRVTGRDGKS